MNHYLNLKKSNCKNCYKCIRNCPVKSIRFSDNQANIVEDECILCGMCFVACPQNAKEIRNDVNKVKTLIASGRPVYASLAPSFIANYDGMNFETMEKNLMKLGFAGAGETAEGATIVKKRYEEMVRESERTVLISSCCHSVNTLIQKYYPEALPYLARVQSPMQAHCTEIKKEHPDALTVFIGPCISKKEEAARYPGMVDAVLTFEELTGWFEEADIHPEKTEDHRDKGRARLFPVAGGILRSMNCDREDFNYISIDGLDNCIRAIEDVVNGNIEHTFIEMSACAGSCIGGPAMGQNRRTPIRDVIAVNRYAGELDFNITQPMPDEIAKEIPFLGLHRLLPGNSTIEEILKQMGKSTPEQELNCGSCGYNTCREKAVAVYLGKADLSMCLPYLKEKAESFSDKIINNTPNGIMVLNENLEIQQINNAACTIFNIAHHQDVQGSPVVQFRDPGDYIHVLSTGMNIHNKRNYLEGYDRHIEETILYDKSYHIIMSIMRDVTEEEKRRSKKEENNRTTVDIADKVILKQMRVVQEIASLLGETTAETKIALENLKRILDNE